MDELSDGEIVGDEVEVLSDISSDDYFNNLKTEFAKAKARKTELEVENAIADFGKENRYRKSHKNKNRRRKVSDRKTSRLDRSRRASSVFSSYSIRKRPQSSRSKRTEKRVKQTLESSLSLSSDAGSDDDDPDNELLRLRLYALQSKLEAKEDVPEEKQPAEVAVEPAEEENLRILALRSAVLKKKDSIKERKRQRMLENERPYSPTDNLSLFPMEEDMSLSPPLGSPCRHTEVDMEISNSPGETSDMDIECEPPVEINKFKKVEPSPVAQEDQEDEDTLRSLVITSLQKTKDFVPQVSVVEMAALENDAPAEHEIHPVIPTTPEIILSTHELKLAAQRMKLQEEMNLKKTKTGSKTIAMILAEKKAKEARPEPNIGLLRSKANQIKADLNSTIAARLKALEDEESKSAQKVEMSKPPDSALPKSSANLLQNIKRSLQSQKQPVLHSTQKQANSKTVSQAPLLSSKQTTPQKTSVPQSDIQKPEEPVPYVANKPPTPPINASKSRSTSPQDLDTNFATITDTKNIPLLASSSEKSKKSRLVTTLDNVIKPVPRLIIKVNVESDSEDEPSRLPMKKVNKRIVVAPKPKLKVAETPGFEKNLDIFLKTVREKMVPEVTKEMSTPTTSKTASSTSKITSSTVKHLPKSSQLEYESLVQKMKLLEAESQKRSRLRRPKSISTNSEAKITASPPKKLEKPPTPVKKPMTSSEKIKESLSRISQLDKDAQHRLIAKTEANFKNHSDKLYEATAAGVKILTENELDMQKQQKLSAQIVDLEKLLKKYKSNLNVVNQRVKVNIHKIVQSHRETAKLRQHQKNFGEHICLPAGKMVLGEEYNLPQHRLLDLEENFMTIAEKTEKIAVASSDQNVKNNMKIICERMKSYIRPKIAEETIPSQANVKVDEKVAVETATDQSAKENTATPAENSQTLSEEPKTVDTTSKRALDQTPVDEKLLKKIKYDSPLDFMKMPERKYDSRGRG